MVRDHNQDLINGCIVLVVVSSVYSIVVDTKRKKENDRLKRLIYEAEAMLQEEKKE
ncbi:MAG: hypothetical protein IMW92_12265 [Bacillales bacterium]|nr:hypothetical protein [Bacillales bacterium]